MTRLQIFYGGLRYIQQSPNKRTISNEQAVASPRGQTYLEELEAIVAI